MHSELENDYKRKAELGFTYLRRFDQNLGSRLIVLSTEDKEYVNTLTPSTAEALFITNLALYLVNNFRNATALELETEMIDRWGVNGELLKKLMLVLDIFYGMYEVK